MSRQPPDPLSASTRVLRALTLVNLLGGVAISAMLAASLVAPGPFMGALGVHPDDQDGGMILAMRTIMLIGIGAVPLAHVVLTRLRAIVDTVGLGDPFVAENASRLQTIAWLVLGLELMHVTSGIVAMSVSTDTTPLGVRWNFSLTPWLAVLLLFVLARVFAHGAQMRADLAGTV